MREKDEIYRKRGNLLPITLNNKITVNIVKNIF